MSAIWRRRAVGTRQGWIWIAVAALLLNLLGGWPLGAGGARAAGTVTVNSLADTTGDSTICTLRDALKVINDGAQHGGCPTTPGADTVDFSVTGTIILGSQLPTVTNGFTLQGPGAGALTIMGSTTTANKFRLFTLNTASAVTIAGVTLSGGDLATTSAAGGAISATVGELTVKNAVISGNNAGLEGGGIVTSGNITVTNSTLSGNTAGTSGGGGIFTSGAITVMNSTFDGNTAAGGSGGGFYASGPVTVTNSTFGGNSSGTGGGGFGGGSTVTVAGSTFANNTANTSGSGGGGGGIAALGATTVTNSTFSWEHHPELFWRWWRRTLCRRQHGDGDEQHLQGQREHHLPRQFPLCRRRDADAQEHRARRRVGQGELRD